MATQANVQEVSRKAGADLSTKQFYLVKLDTAADRQVILAAANADVCEGVLTNKPTSGKTAAVQVNGQAKVIYGATVTRGAALMSDTSGRAITQTSTNPIIGYALESGAVNEIHAIDLTT